MEEPMAGPLQDVMAYDELRVRLAAGTTPWEFLYDTFRQDFVGLSRRASLVRKWNGTGEDADGRRAPARRRNRPGRESLNHQERPKTLVRAC
jgi:hypothetical protein